MAHKPVGLCSTIVTGSSSVQSIALNKQTDTLRVVAIGNDAHVAIGTNPTATVQDYLVTVGNPETILISKPSSQRVVGVTTGSTTIIDFPEGTGSPFAVGDTVSLTVSGQSYYDFTHKAVESVNTTANVGGYYNTRIVVTHDSSGITTAFNTPEANLRESFKVAAVTRTGSGSLYIQQVQTSGAA